MNILKNTPKKILIINIFGIGDVLFTYPLISNLKLNFPDAYIGYVGNKRTEPLLSDHPLINKVFVYERDDFNQEWKRSKIGFLKKMKAFASDIKKEGFDTVFDFSLNTSANFLTWLIGIKSRIGFNYRNRSPLLTIKIPFDGFYGKHVVEHYFDLLKTLNLKVEKKRIEIVISKKNLSWADDFLKDNGVTSKDIIFGVLPGAGISWGKGAAFRRWDVEKYAKLVDKMIEKFSAKVILMGDKNEENLCNQVSKKGSLNIIEAYSKTNICQLAALLSKCHLVVLNDGGPLHVAVGVGARTVSIFGPVDDDIYGPYPKAGHAVVTSALPCRPCYRKFRQASCDHLSCLKQISVEDVLKKVEEVYIS